ncbi:MAG: UDP-glucose--hexose-1-phosphate uridylyltransferase [Treponema sp.]|nr:UDP-glucose--hexose-1-phosphate uridylyltransferase [Treponema sp.]
MNIFDSINRLAAYGIKTGLIEKEDLIYVKNRLLAFLGIEGYEDNQKSAEVPDVQIQNLEEILKSILDYAGEKKLIDAESVTERDLFDSEIMSIMTDRPSNIIGRFYSLYKKSPKEATDWFYRFSQDTDYIRRYRISRDVKWISSTEYGDMDITINLSKPEKDPRAIAAARNNKTASYPSCQLCKENEGYKGRLNHPGRSNHRIIPIELAGEKWGFQYSPYVYYNEHCIVFNTEHVPMQITEKTFMRLFDFVTMFPHYILGSNADLPIVGGSILTHDHFQGGAYDFPMARAGIAKNVQIRGFEDVSAGIVKWPMSVLRIKSSDKNRLIELAGHVLDTWRNYTDEKAFVYAETDGEKHNTLNPIARKRGDLFEMDLVLRNNITTEEHPLGVYHPHAELHHIKKENIGLIEVMGLAILPGRLKNELNDLAMALIQDRDIRNDESLNKHADWADELKEKYGRFSGMEHDKALEIIKKETGIVFSKVLEHAGVFKYNQEGLSAFERFIAAL